MAFVGIRSASYDISFGFEHCPDAFVSSSSAVRIKIDVFFFMRPVLARRIKIVLEGR